MIKISVSVDDGHPLDIKAAEILARKNIQTTFYVPIRNSTGRPTLNKKQIRFLSRNSLFTIGSHTYSHIDLTKVPLNMAKREMISGKKELEDIIGKEVDMFSWPFGKYNLNLVKLAKSIGFKHCRDATFIKFSEFDNQKFLLSPNLYIFPKTIIQDAKHSLKKFDLFSLIYRLRFFYKNHLELVQILENIQGYKEIHFWFHSWQMEEMNLWNIIELI